MPKEDCDMKVPQLSSDTKEPKKYLQTTKFNAHEIKNFWPSTKFYCIENFNIYCITLIYYIIIVYHENQ